MKLDTGRVALVALAGAIGLGLLLSPGGNTSGRPAVSEAARRVGTERAKAERAYAARDFSRAERELSVLVKEYEGSADPHVQDQVGVARLQLGYAAARQGDYRRARAYFQDAEDKYRGTDFQTADFGGIEDQAAYQAAVCLAASGEKTQAVRAFLAFLDQHPTSPLIKAAHRRLLKLDPASRERYDDLLQQKLDAQGAKARLERATCGPKALAYLLERVRGIEVDYQALVAECGTTEEGTTLADMKRALAGRGIPSYGYELARADFARLRLPALWLRGEHFLVVEDIGPASVTFYDPTRAARVTEPLAPPSDTQFLATVLSLYPVDIEASK